MKPIQVVSPYRPFVPESIEHQLLGPFDWVGALTMMADTVTRTCGCPTFALTDVDTTLPVPAWQYPTTARRLMVWILEVSYAFLQSPHFNRNTVMISPDLLVCRDLAPYFIGDDLGVMVRTGDKWAQTDRPMLNGCQFWAIDGRDRLIAFYADALAIAQDLPEPLATWGGDTEPLRRLLDPLINGRQARHGLTVTMWDVKGMMESLSSVAIERLDAGLPLYLPSRPLLDFKYLRKQRMADVYRAIFLEGIPT